MGGFAAVSFQVIPPILFCFLLSAISAISNANPETFIQCISSSVTSNCDIFYSRNNSAYSSILEFSIQNLMFNSSITPKPQYIITPLHESHIQAAVICSKLCGLQIRVRSGGHDYEGLSYISHNPFVIIDLVKFEAITVDIENETAWVQAGATVGQVYYKIAEQSPANGFPAGICTTTGVGGYISGGGIGFLMRKYGLAADNVIDVNLVDVNGRVLDRKSMGEDLFWAIRGGGGASFGVIVSWKIRLVRVPSIVTVFSVWRTLEQGGSNIFFKWQTIAHKLPEDLTIRAIVQPKNRTIQVQFQGMFLGRVGGLLSVIETAFRELGLEEKDCAEMSWINSTLYIPGLKENPLDVLLNRSQQRKKYFKGKSDFVKEPISMIELENIWKVMLEEEISVSPAPMLICEPFGGRMDEISEFETPFPHRVGNLYNIQYFIEWEEADGGLIAAAKYVESIRRLYTYLTPFVSKSPRASYLNYKDLDLGTNKDASTSYLEASVWGEKYFKGNFEKLAFVKAKVDPENFFWNEQSIPPLVQVEDEDGRAQLFGVL